jgi:hypothetical protein
MASAFKPDYKPSQDDLVQYLWREEAVDEVAFSIAKNGYYEEERLLTIRAAQANSFIVVEGNRRLAAVRLLLDPHLREKVGASELPAVTKSIREQLATLPTSLYASRKDLWSYLGFRHINGTKPWDAHSKAEYVADVHEKYNVPLDEIADRIGDRHSTVERLYRGLKLLQQAEKQASFDIDDRVKNRFSFSHLYTAADQPGYQEFLGITSAASLKPNPVPKSKVPQLGELMTWLYGKKSANKDPLVQSQNPDLNTLREVIATKQGLSALRAGYSLAASHNVSIGDPRRFREALTRALEELKNAKGKVVGGFKGETDLIDLMDSILEQAASIKRDMDEAKRKPAKKS